MFGRQVAKNGSTADARPELLWCLNNQSINIKMNLPKHSRQMQRKPDDTGFHAWDWHKDGSIQKRAGAKEAFFQFKKDDGVEEQKFFGPTHQSIQRKSTGTIQHSNNTGCKCPNCTTKTTQTKREIPAQSTAHIGTQSAQGNNTYSNAPVQRGLISWVKDKASSAAGWVKDKASSAAK